MQTVSKEGFYTKVMAYLYTGAYIVYFRKSSKKSTKFLYHDKNFG